MPARFKGGATNLNPLRLQLTTVDTIATLVEWRAALQATAGSTFSRPRLSRPTVVGAALARTPGLGVNTFAASNAEVISQFSVAPSLPVASPMIYTQNSHISYQWQAPTKGGLVVLPATGLLLYALGSLQEASPGTWDGEMLWEESL